jgi:hypothetical protein
MQSTKGKAVIPDEECIEHGTKLLSQIHRGASSRDGEMRDELDNVRYRYERRASRFGWGFGNPFRKPDFVLSEPSDKEETIIRRVSFVPPVFNIVEASAVIGTIRMLSMFRNKYSISIDGVKSWTFRMPLFTVLFFGESDAGAEIWVRVGPSVREWNILIKPGITRRPLIAALAFIHHERYFYV